MLRLAGLVAALCALVVPVRGHGQLTWPPARNGGHITLGGSCANGACYWFTNNVEVTTNTLPKELRSVEVGVEESSAADVYKTSPWRAPGTAVPFGSGCGVAGGGPVAYPNGGTPPDGVEQNADGLDLPPSAVATTWTRGGTAEVAWAISANHNGGYAYRLCKKGGEVNEACFERLYLKFAKDEHRLAYPNGTFSAPFPMHKVPGDKVHPVDTEWARNPIPGCMECGAHATCGAPLPLPTEDIMNYDSAWNQQVNCYGSCDGSSSSKSTGTCPPAKGTQFPEPLPGLSGFGKNTWQWSIADTVQVPADIEAGEYILSWRWDCEESTQVWQNCADISIVDEAPASGETFAEITPAAIEAAPEAQVGSMLFTYGENGEIETMADFCEENPGSEKCKTDGGKGESMGEGKGKLQCKKNSDDPSCKTKVKQKEGSEEAPKMDASEVMREYCASLEKGSAAYSNKGCDKLDEADEADGADEQSTASAAGASAAAALGLSLFLPCPAVRP